MSPGGGSKEATQLKSLKARRAQIKAKCTRFSFYLEELEVQNMSVVELRQRLQRFTETWDHFNEIQTAIEKMQANAQEVVSEEEERNSFEEKYFIIASRLEMLIDNKIRPMHTANVNIVPRDIREGTPAIIRSIPSNEHLKLPRVNLPTFSGRRMNAVPQYVSEHDRSESCASQYSKNAIFDLGIKGGGPRRDWIVRSFRRKLC